METDTAISAATSLPLVAAYQAVPGLQGGFVESWLVQLVDMSTSASPYSAYLGPKMLVHQIVVVLGGPLRAFSTHISTSLVPMRPSLGGSKAAPLFRDGCSEAKGVFSNPVCCTSAARF